jgi:hypothetical protein
MSWQQTRPSVCSQKIESTRILVSSARTAKSMEASLPTHKATAKVPPGNFLFGRNNPLTIPLRFFGLNSHERHGPCHNPVGYTDKP